MDKANGDHFQWFEIKMAWWLVLFPFPKEMKIQSPQWWMEGKGGKGKDKM
jgi:hypothetical protein